MKISLGISPCPNDTFIFDALVNGKIDTEGLEFEVRLEDVQTLNEWAKQGKLDVSKISYGVLPLVLKNYLVLSSGGALGKGVGPLLIAASAINISDSSVVAIPGENTTAHLLFSLAYPQVKNKVFKVFNEIEDAILKREVDAGVIIHENRFTYLQKGLVKLKDLGEYWEESTKAPIPLGGIITKRSLDRNFILKMDKLIRKSVEYSYRHNHEQLSQYVKQYAQEMSEQVMRQHIDLYVNNYSLVLGEKGKQAVLTLLNVFKKIHSSAALFEDNEIFAV